MKDLFGYLIETRYRFLAKFQEIGWNEFARNREASWLSMLGIFLLILEVEVSWLHYTSQGLSVLDVKSLKTSDFRNFQQLSEFNSSVREKTKVLLLKLSDSDLSEEISFLESRGSTKCSRSKILMHAFVDEVAHLGELVCLLWQMDEKPPFIDWLYYSSAGDGQV